MAEICGVDAALIRQAARLYAQNKPSLSVHGLGMTEHTQGTEGVMCIVNLVLLTGNLGKKGAGVNPLRGFDLLSAGLAGSAGALKFLTRNVSGFD